jgi:signal transduction histidine kinase
LEEFIEQDDTVNVKATHAKIRQHKEDLDLDFLHNDINELISESRTGIERARSIVVLNLKNCSHLDKDHQITANLNQNLETSLNASIGDLPKKAALVNNFSAIPDVFCYPCELDQTFVAVLINAAQAVHGKVRIEIRTHRDNGYVEIADDGQGISPEVQKRIFELFCYKQGFPQWNRPGFKHGLLPLRRSTRRPTFR